MRLQPHSIRARFNHALAPPLSCVRALCTPGARGRGLIWCWPAAAPRGCHSYAAIRIPFVCAPNFGTFWRVPHQWTATCRVGARARAAGAGQYGQLGHGPHSPAEAHSPKAVSDLHQLKVVAISCGANHSGVVCADGKVFVWGAEGKCAPCPVPPHPYSLTSAAHALTRPHTL